MRKKNRNNDLPRAFMSMVNYIVLSKLIHFELPGKISCNIWRLFYDLQTYLDIIQYDLQNISYNQFHWPNNLQKYHVAYISVLFKSLWNNPKSFQTKLPCNCKTFICIDDKNFESCKDVIDCPLYEISYLNWLKHFKFNRIRKPINFL